MIASARSAVTTLAVIASTSPAVAQWSRVMDVPVSNIVSVWANGDTIAAGADSVVHVSTNAGATWKQSAPVAAGAISIKAVGVRNGQLYAGTFGQGVFVSQDLGDTWLAFNQGLAGGLFNSHLFISDLLVHGDKLYAATSGAGIYVRNLTAGTWQHFGEELERNSASNTNGIAAAETRLFVSAGANGMAFFRDPGDADWTRSWLDNVGVVPGLAALSAAWTGKGWVVGANTGVFRSALGQEPWTFVDLGLGTLFIASLAQRGGELFAAFGNGGATIIARSADDGATWQVLDTQPAVFVNRIAIRGTDLYAGRLDGLWRRSTATPVKALPWGAVKSRFR